MSCNLRIFMDQPTEPIPSGNPSSRRDDRRFGGPKRWACPKGAVRAVAVVMVDILGQHPPQLPAADDHAEELARVAAAPVGYRNRQLWESARNLYNLVATGALDHHQVDRGLLAAAERCGLLTDEPRQTRRTLASARQVGLAHPASPPNTPILTAPNRRHCPHRRVGGTASGPDRNRGDALGRRRPRPARPGPRGGACRHQAEPAPTPTTPQEGAPGWAAHQP
jgi:hypothetical protein